MKKKTTFIFSFLSIVFAALSLMSGCDMDAIQKPFTPPPAPEPAPEPASYLTIFNLPAHTRQNHVSNVSVSNQSKKIGVCRSYNDITVENNGGTSTVKIPLAYSGTDLRFDATGSYFVSLDVNIDAFVRYTIAENDKFPLDFVDGNAFLDASLIGYVPPEPPIPYSHLTIANLPANTLKNHFSAVFIYNSTGVTAKCADYNQIIIIKDNGSVTAKIPLSYFSNPDCFKETGTFTVSFNINIDYASYYSIKENDKLRLYFTDGNAYFDASLIPPPPPPYLTIISLPANTRAQNISNVFVYNNNGTVAAKCADYDQIIITRDALSVTARIPLYYNNKNEHFVDTGAFVVSLYVNINFETQIILKEEDKFTVFFTEGNAVLDASLIPPAPPPPYLTITSLPKNTNKNNLSNVFVYNSIGTVTAKCPDYSQIIISTNSDYASAKIPLVYNSGGQPFRDSGYLIVSFSLNIDNYIQISKTRDDALTVPFTDGSGTLDFLNTALSGIERGYFSGSLINPSDTTAPVIRSGTKFEMNGYYYTLNSNTSVASASFSNSCIVYVYARLVFNQIDFIYSTTAPVYDNYKKGYYNGFYRALFKFVFIRDSTNKYFAKVFINDGWSHLRYQTVDSGSIASQNLFQHYFLSGSDNPDMHTVSLPAGVYLITLKGASGGHVSTSSEQTIPGGAGGSVSEVVILSKNSSFSFFTGERGKDGLWSSYSYTGSSGSTSGGGGFSSGGGGGGSGSFAFSPDGYLLCAGGGGDSYTLGYASNMSYSSGYGGAGGSIGGGGTGADGSFTYIHESTGYPSGGSGGGRYPETTPLTVYSFSLGYNGISSSFNSVYNGKPAAYFDLPAPYNWLNTNNANGKGGDQSGAAQNGGNNRNSLRGGGGETSGTSAQTSGSITVFKIN